MKDGPFPRRKGSQKTREMIRFFMMLTLAGFLAAPAATHAECDSLGEPESERVVVPDADVLDDFDPLADIELEPTPKISDPLEPMNRVFHAFNQGLDFVLLNPVARVYGFLVPDLIKDSVRRALQNLNSPAILANDLFQREWKDAGTTVARFAINSSFGVVGLFDQAERVGLPAHESDFGQTLALAGVSSGPFLVLPVFGPTSVRDGASALVDGLFRPTTYVLGFADQLIFNSIQGTSYGIAIREDKIEEMDALKASSVDYYAALKSAYYQNRVAHIWERREHRRKVQTEEGSPGLGAETPSNLARR